MSRRAYEIRDLRLERAAGGTATKLGGYAAVFDSESVDLGGFTERIAKGAFGAGLAKADVRALMNHNPDVVLGRTTSGTLRLSEDDRGLPFELDLPDTQPARDLAVLVARRDITGMSFGFRTLRDTWSKIGPGKWLRTLLEVDLFDVSPVAFPAYPAAEVGMRGAGQDLEAQAGLKAAQANDEARLRRLRLLEKETA